MNMTELAPAIFALLGHDLRWQIIRALAQGDCRIGDLAGVLGQPANVLSYHMGQLRAAALVAERRSDADGRDTYYRLDLVRLRELYQAAGQALHPALIGAAQVESALPQPVRVLFLCTHNSARSQMAEALLRVRGGTAFDAYSAGSAPSTVHPATRRVLEAAGIASAALRAKDVAEFTGQPFDYVITVCDRMREVCPTFPGGPTPLHWSIADPALAHGEPLAQDQAFERTFRELNMRIGNFILIVKREHFHETPRTDSVYRELGPLTDG